MTRWLMRLLPLLLVSCATAGSPPPLEEAVHRLAQFTRADVERGRDIAQAKQDVAAANCSNALLAHIPEGGTLASSLPPAGAWSAYITARELHRATQGAGIPEDIHIACAPLVVDAEDLLIRLGLIAAGGGLPGLPVKLSVPSVPGISK